MTKLVGQHGGQERRVGGTAYNGRWTKNNAHVVLGDPPSTDLYRSLSGRDGRETGTPGPAISTHSVGI